MFRVVAEHVKRHPGLVPQFFFICLGMGGASLYLIRLARGPHVTWNKTDNPEPWNNLDPTYQYKFVAITTDYKNLKKEGPDFEPHRPESNRRKKEDPDLEGYTFLWW